MVLIHGFGTCAFLWRQLAPALAAAGFTAIAIDLLGHGESDSPDEGDFSLPAQAEHVARALAALRIPSAALIGQGIGGLVALLLAASPRIRISGVALVSPPDPDDLPGSDIRALQRQSALVALSANTLFGARAALAPLLLSGVHRREHMPALLISRYLAPFVGPDGLAQLMLRAATVALDGEARARLIDVTSPVLVIEGAKDPSLPKLDWARLLSRSTIRSIRVEESGRLIPEDAPDALRTLILEWLGELSEAAIAPFSH